MQAVIITIGHTTLSTSHMSSHQTDILICTGMLRPHSDDDGSVADLEECDIKGFDIIRDTSKDIRTSMMVERQNILYIFFSVEKYFNIY